MAATLLVALPSEDEAFIAHHTSQILARRQTNGPMLLRLIDSPEAESIRLPSAAVQMLVRILEEMARGNTVTLVPVRAELTTQEAAAMLNMSRLSLIQLLDEGRIEYRKVGTHRRVRFEALMAYKRKAEADRRAALAELAAYDQEFGI